MRLLRSLFLLIFPNALCLAQTTPPAPPAAIYPTRIATLNDLQEAANLAYSTLTAPAAATDTALSVAAPGVFPIPTTITVDSEIVRICGKTTNQLTVCANGRGVEGTVANQHAAGTYVEQRMTATFHNQMAAEVMAIEKRGYNTKYITDFGAVCDGVTDDAPAIRAAIAAAITGPNNEYLGGAVYFPDAGNLPPQLPSASCGVKSSIIVPAGVRLIGNGTLQGPFLAALPGGTWSTYEDITTYQNHTFLLQVGQITSGSNFGVSIEHLGVAGNGYVQTTIWSENLEEASGLFDVSANGFTQFGVDFLGYGTQNSFIQTITTNPAPGAVNTTAIRWVGGNSRQRISDMTLQGGGAGTQQHSDAMYLVGDFKVNNVHCELYDTCVHAYQGLIDTELIDNNGTNTVVNSLVIEPGVAGTFLETSGLQTEICDKSIPGTGSCAGATNVTNITAYGGNQAVGFHSTSTVLNGTYLSLANGVGALLPKLILTGNLTLDGQLQMGHQSIIDMGGSLGLILNNSNPLGLQIQSNTTTGYGTREGGGLCLGGGGFAGNPSLGNVMAGACTDGGTAIATAPTSAGMLLSGGKGILYANVGLLVDYPFQPNGMAQWDAYSFQFAPTPTPPPCATINDHGRLWINSSVSPYRVEYCIDTGWVYVTTNPGP